MRIALCSCPSSRRQFSRCHRNSSFNVQCSNVRGTVDSISCICVAFSLLEQATDVLYNICSEIVMAISLSDGHRPHQLLFIRHFNQKLRVALSVSLTGSQQTQLIHLEALFFTVNSPINLFWIINGLAYMYMQRKCVHKCTHQVP